MAEKWTVNDVVAFQVGDQPCWQVSLTRPDGSTANHVLPTVALEWRAAEYGIDPTDVDALLEVVLHEPHLPVIDDAQRGPHYADDGPDLWTAENTSAARDAHIARIKACPVQIKVAGVKAVDVIRAGHQPDAARLARMREAVDTNRWIRKHGSLPVRPRDPLDARVPATTSSHGKA